MSRLDKEGKEIKGAGAGLPTPGQSLCKVFKPSGWRGPHGKGPLSHPTVLDPLSPSPQLDSFPGH
jgi:hypothetical protein